MPRVTGILARRNISKVFKNGFVIWQSPGEEIPEVAILGHVDNGGSIVLEQEGRSLVIQEGTVRNLISVLLELQKEAAKAKG
jgi:hypothetical protein